MLMQMMITTTMIMKRGKMRIDCRKRQKLHIYEVIFDDVKKDFEMAHGRAAAICPPFENALAEAEPALRRLR